MAALRIFEYPHDVGGPVNWGMVELIEATVRAGTPELAVDVCSRLATMARASGTDWALGLATRSEALLADAERAEECYVEAIDRLGRKRGWRSISLVLTFCTVNGLDVSVDALMHAANCGRRTSCLPISGLRRLPSADVSSWRRPASMPANAPSKRGATSPRKRRRSRASPARAYPMRRSACGLHQQTHRRVPPPQGLRQARDQLAHQTRTRPATRAEVGAPPVARSARRAASVHILREAVGDLRDENDEHEVVQQLQRADDAVLHHGAVGSRRSEPVAERRRDGRVHRPRPYVGVHASRMDGGWPVMLALSPIGGRPGTTLQRLT